MSESIRKANKYLVLAIAMKETRLNWSEGFYRVEDALKTFQIESEQDQAIYADISGCLHEEDGRVFRDTTWNYDRLFELVDIEIMNRIKEIREGYCPSFNFLL